MNFKRTRSYQNASLCQAVVVVVVRGAYQLQIEPDGPSGQSVCFFKKGQPHLVSSFVGFPGKHFAYDCWPKRATFLTVNRGEADNQTRLLLPNHPPKVTNCPLQGMLGNNELPTIEKA